MYGFGSGLVAKQQHPRKRSIGRSSNLPRQLPALLSYGGNRRSAASLVVPAMPEGVRGQAIHGLLTRCVAQCLRRSARIARRSKAQPTSWRKHYNRVGRHCGSPLRKRFLQRIGTPCLAQPKTIRSLTRAKIASIPSTRGAGPSKGRFPSACLSFSPSYQLRRPSGKKVPFLEKSGLSPRYTRIFALSEGVNIILPAGPHGPGLHIEPRHTARLTALPFHHKDPFDRLLVAQAAVENIPIISNDATLDAYGIVRLW